MKKPLSPVPRYDKTAIHRFKSIFLLGAILLISIILRCYDLSFPSIGYHCMQENEYMGIAQEMKRTGDYLTKRVYFSNNFDPEQAIKTDPQPPLVAYQTLIAWKFFGENLWGPRLFNVLFGVLSIVVIYLIADVLFANVKVSLFSAFLLAVTPLAVFFSRNLQPESPAFFFMLLGNLLYLKFAAIPKMRTLFFGGLFFSIAWLYKFSFLFGAIPLLLCFPFRAISKDARETAAYSLAFFLPYSIILAISVWNGQWHFSSDFPSRLFNIFLPSYWKEHGPTIWWYVKKENLTIPIAALSFAGIAVAFLSRKRLAERYIMGWALTLIPYGMVFSSRIYENNYSHMPFLALVSVSAAYAVFRVSGAVKIVVKKDLLIFLTLVISGVSAPFIYEAISRLHQTAFIGVDVAGESLKGFTKPDERIFLFTHPQGYGIARYAQRYCGWTNNVDEFREKEKKFAIRYICFYPADFARSVKANYPALFEYIQGHYHLKELGLTEGPQQLFYIILEKGNPANTENFLESFTGTRQLKTIYRISGRYIFFYAMTPLKEMAGFK